jgi:hypothetical protein
VAQWSAFLLPDGPCNLVTSSLNRVVLSLRVSCIIQDKTKTSAAIFTAPVACWLSGSWLSIKSHVYTTNSTNENTNTRREHFKTQLIFHVVVERRRAVSERERALIKIGRCSQKHNWAIFSCYFSRTPNTCSDVNLSAKRAAPELEYSKRVQGGESTSFLLA